MTKPAIIQAELEEFLGDKLNGISPEKAAILFQTYSKKRKHEVIYLFWFFNFHYAYVKKWWLLFLFLISFGGVAIWWVIDLFRLDTILKEYNKAKAEELFEELQV